MQFRQLGTTGIRISAVSFGAGPVPALLTATEQGDLQLATVRRAVEAGVNWFDTAATYGNGQSESALGRALSALAPAEVHIATKVRIPAERLDDIRGYVRDSFTGSLERLRQPRVTLLQLHNSITPRRGDQPTSLTPADILGPNGVVAAFAELRDRGLVDHLGLTGLGHPQSLIEVLRSREFETLQTPYHLLNPSAGSDSVPAGAEADYGNLIGECERLNIGVLAIRVFAGGALAGQPPSAHTRTTQFFPLNIYESDQRRAAELLGDLPADLSLRELALRYVLSHHGVSSALVGFASPTQIDESLDFAEHGPLDERLLAWLSQR